MCSDWKMNFPGCSRTRACFWLCFALLWIHTWLSGHMCACVFALWWKTTCALSGGRTLINNLTGKTNKAENMGCTGGAVFCCMSQSCLITLAVSKAMHLKLSARYAREILIKGAIDLNCVVNRHTWLDSQHLPFSRLCPLSVSIPTSSLFISSYLQLHTPII